MSENKKIEVINGNENDLEISQVYEHIDGVEKPRTEKKKKIVVPKKKEETNKKNNEKE